MYIYVPRGVNFFLLALQIQQLLRLAKLTLAGHSVQTKQVRYLCHQVSAQEGLECNYITNREVTRYTGSSPFML